MVLTFLEETTPGICRYSLDLAALYPNGAARGRFEARYLEFLASAPEHPDLFGRDGQRLIYLSESFLSRVVDDRPPVLLVLGNPGSRSVCAGMCFAFEQPGCREHRFWKALREVGWLRFKDDAAGDVRRYNAERRKALLEGDYASPFRIGIDVFHTVPSGASHIKWGGVTGLHALFGREAMARIADAERLRLARTIADFAGEEGAVVAFQKDAYEGLRDALASSYSQEAARSGKLSGTTAAGEPVRLFGALPTRLAHTGTFREALTRIGETILGDQCSQDASLA